MRSKFRSLVLVIACLLSLVTLAGGAYFGAMGMMDSVYAYRSPLKDRPPKPGQSLGQPLTRRVVIVLVDALRLDTSLKPEVMPFLNKLRQRAASATMHSRPPSYSEPGYTVLLTGAWPELSDGPVINLPYEEIPTFTQDNLFSAAHRAGLKTAISGYYWFEKLLPQEAVDASYYTPGEDQAADRAVVDAALDWLETGKYHLVLVHLDQVDYAGHHEGGPRDPRWDAAAQRADGLIRELAEKLDLSQDTLLVVSDHGQIYQGGHGGQDAITLIEPFALVGAGVKVGQYGDIQMVDVAPTVAALLGLNIPASSQGRVLTEMLTLSPEQERIISQATIDQQKQLLQSYFESIGYKGNVDQVKYGDQTDEIVRAYQDALEKARRTRLNAERLPRSILSLLLAGIPIVWFYRKRRKETFALLGGGFVYILIFNIRYALLDHRTYSLSSVTSAEDLIFYVATTAVMAMVISWLVVIVGLRLYQSSPLQATLNILGLSLGTIYLLPMPVLWSFAMNGLIAKWSLPDFASMFLGFISTLQILIVAAAGTILSGLSALIAAIFSSRWKGAWKQH